MSDKTFFAQENSSPTILKRMPEEEVYGFSPELKDVENSVSIEQDSSELPPQDIVAFNELRSCAELYRMWTKNQINLQPDFQRGLVWSTKEQSRFVDSLMKQLPIPSLCISWDSISNKRLVIDGLQRIQTIIEFLKEKDNNFKVEDIEDIFEDIRGKTPEEIKNSSKNDLYAKLENWSIPVTVIRGDFSKPNHMKYLFTIFHRLNSGGSRLNNQEIRNCIFNGPFNTFLKETVNHPNYKALFKIKSTKNYRFSFEELNLRYFSFSEKLPDYDGKLAQFLNDYMFEMLNVNAELIEKKKEHFEKVIEIVYEKIFSKKSVGKISKTLMEAVFVGVGKNIKYLERISDKTARSLFEKLKADPDFSTANIREGVAQKAKVVKRLNKAIKIFSGK